MDREHVTDIVTEKLKLIRTESNYTQDKMADILGISKKTLVQIEKGRISAGWTTTVAICALFRESSILQNAFGGDPMDVIELTAHDIIIRPKEKTMGGYIWWRNVEELEGYRLQQNVLSNHYRIIDDENYRLFSSIEKDVIQEKWIALKQTINL
ncbi:helix-turn-helix transcriptional regulator [Lysinibacillus sp. 54212]|uniref:helix-turn-helix transcriptional regulator n=1 Tax=Lysinibacillus sp. 54212 TaxID=3119829 RepID=UPI002FCB199D